MPLRWTQKKTTLCGYMIFKENKGVSLKFTTKLVKRVPHHPQLSVVFQHKLPKGKTGSGLQWQSQARTQGGGGCLGGSNTPLWLCQKKK